MKVHYAGFNLCGLVTDSESVVKRFTGFTYDSLKSLHLTHTFGIAQNDESVFLHGYYNKKTHQSIEIKTDLGKTISRISVYDNKAYILYDTGEVYRVNFFNNLRLDQQVINIEEQEIDRIVDIAAGSDDFIVVTKEGRIYNVPNKLNFINDDIVQVVAGGEHCILLDGSGNVYTFGNGSRGQLGHGDLVDREHPVQVEALAGVKIKKVAAGSWHSCALSETGDLYAWGWNQDDQLGLYDKDSHEKKSVVGTPEPVNFPDFEANVTDVACGTRHTVAVLGNKVYGAGQNKYYQLGSEDADDKTPMKCLYVSDAQVLSVTCGPWCTAILTIKEAVTSGDPPGELCSTVQVS